MATRCSCGHRTGRSAPRPSAWARQAHAATPPSCRLHLACGRGLASSQRASQRHSAWGLGLASSQRASQWKAHREATLAVGGGRIGTAVRAFGSGWAVWSCSCPLLM